MKKRTTQVRPNRTSLYESEAYLQLKKNVSDNLKRIRTERGMTQEALAHQCNLAVRQYQSVEVGTSNATFLTLSRIMEGLGVSGGELLDPPKKKQ